MWPYVLGFLAFPAIMGVYCLIASYCKLFSRIADLERQISWHDEKYQTLYDRVIFEIPAIMRKNGWTV